MHEPLTMETIHAAHNLTIELGPASWRLYNGVQARPGALAALVEATDGGVACSPAFARARQLPGPDLRPADIARVVVGWAPESRNWHLGLLLAARPESHYRMRWCGLASWPSGAVDESSGSARLAGQALARVINRPFHLVPAPAEAVNPLADTQPLEVTTPLLATPVQPAIPLIALREPPFTFEEWAFEAIPKGYLWQQRGRSVLSISIRVIVLGLLSMLFVLLGIGTQTSGLAAVKPAWLPVVGLAVAGVIALLAVQNARALFTLSDVIVDTTQREVRSRSRLFGRVRWRLPFDRVAYVVLSQTPAQALGRVKTPGGAGSAGASAPDQDVMRVACDAWIHLYDGSRFYEVARLGRVEGQSHRWSLVQRMQQHKGRRRLQVAACDTGAQHAAAVLARVLSTDVWLDVI